MNIQRGLAERIASRDQLHLKRVEVRTGHLPGKPQDLPISHVEIFVVDLVGGNVKVPVSFIAVLAQNAALIGVYLSNRRTSSAPASVSSLTNDS